MKNLIIAILGSILFVSCNNNPKAHEDSSGADTTTVAKHAYEHLYGMWVGYLEPKEIKDESLYRKNKITLIIKHIENGKVTGRSVVAGNERPLQGTLSETNQKVSLVLDEPGSDKYDGRFEFELRNDTLVGIWKSYKKDINVTQSSFTLIKKAFAYDANLMLDKEGDYTDWESAKLKKDTANIDGKIETFNNEYYRSASEAVFTLNSSTQELKENDLKNLRKLDLQILRNTIFARHGYSFKKKTYRQFFDFVDWYIPVSDNVEKDLTALEKKNIKILERFEKYAEDNYDRFGR